MVCFIATSLHISVAYYSLYQYILEQHIWCWSDLSRYQGAVLRVARTHCGWMLLPAPQHTGADQLTTWQFKGPQQNVWTHRMVTLFWLAWWVGLMWEDWRRGNLAMSLLGVRPGIWPLPTVCFLAWPCTDIEVLTHLQYYWTWSIYLTLFICMYCPCKWCQCTCALLLPWHS